MLEKQSKKSLEIDKRVFPFYPLLFGIYPVLTLAAVNIAQIDLSWMFRSLVFSIVITLILFGLLRWVMRSWTKAAFLCLCLLILFFTYGHVYSLLKNVNDPVLGLVRFRYLLAGWIVLGGLALWLSTKKYVTSPSFVVTMNFIVVALMIFPAYQLVQFEIRQELQKPNQPLDTPANNVSTTGEQSYPDIYYIILDAYMRSDNIKAVYGYDNSAFLNALSARGFFIATCGQSNYAYTQPSLASSLNMEYLDKLPLYNDEVANSLIKISSVRKFLKAHGYNIVAFETGWSWSQWENADHYYRYQPNAYLLNEFESLFFQTTLLRIPLDFMKVNESSTENAVQHNRIIYNLDTLENLPTAVKGPKFVFAHLVIPHPPYVFKENGSFRTEAPGPTADLTGYPASVEFISNRMLQIVDRILANSKTPPIIIIQGDHGAFRYNTLPQKLSILNAYYLPASQGKLYPSITPVNTFRVILNLYFNQNYPLLKDVSWFSPSRDRYNFEFVPTVCDK